MTRSNLESLRNLLDEYNAELRAQGFRREAAKGDTVLNCVIDDIETKPKLFVMRTTPLCVAAER